MSKYEHLEKDELIRLLQRRDARRQLGLVWERDESAGGELEADAALNEDYVALDLDPALSHGETPWKNLIIEGDNFDALRQFVYLRKLGERLQSSGSFDVARMPHA
jgi:adenine-specific DNA-methyltransferase